MTTATTAPETTTEEKVAAAAAGRSLPSAVDVGLLLVRVVPFVILAVQGSRKLFGAFGGDGFAATAQAFGQMGYHPAPFFALLGGSSELIGGLLLAFGLCTPLGSAMALGVMINATVAVWSKGLDTVTSPIVLGVLAIALAFAGPGRFSLDAGRPWQRSGFAWAAAGVGLAVVTALGSLVDKLL